MDVEAKVSINPRLFPSLLGARTKTVRDGTNGLSDIFLVPFALNWTFGDLQVNPQFFKPGNIMVRLKDDGSITAKIIDLGLAKAVNEPSAQTAISTPGAFAGTPEFASLSSSREFR